MTLNGRIYVMNDIQLTLVLLGAFWAGTSTVFTGMRHASEVRDRIMLRSTGEDRLSADFLRHLLVMDWFPLKASLAAISLVLALIILFLPTLRAVTAEGNSAAGAESSASSTPGLDTRAQGATATSFKIPPLTGDAFSTVCWIAFFIPCAGFLFHSISCLTEGRRLKEIVSSCETELAEAAEDLESPPKPNVTSPAEDK